MLTAEGSTLTASMLRDLIRRGQAALLSVAYAELKAAEFRPARS